MASTRSQLILLSATLVGSFTVGSLVGRSAGTNAAEEAAIRKVIALADQNGGQLPQQYRLADTVFFSGAMKRPTVGNEKAEPIPGPNTISNRVPGSQRVKTQPIRIVVADSRDLAYDYSKGTLEFDLKTGEHRSTETGVLRVWQKQGGDWKVAGTFVRPYVQ